MSPFSTPVIGGAAVLSAPSLWNVVHGVSPASAVPVRFLVSMVFCWLALELLTLAVGPTVRAQGEPPAGTESAPAASRSETASRVP